MHKEITSNKLHFDFFHTIVVGVLSEMYEAAVNYEDDKLHPIIEMHSEKVVREVLGSCKEYDESEIQYILNGGRDENYWYSPGKMHESMIKVFFLELEHKSIYFEITDWDEFNLIEDATMQ